MLMMMMMMKKKGLKSLTVVALLLAAANCILPPSREDLNQLSLQGEKYVAKQVENAVNGVKEMKSVMEKSSEDHKKFLDALEKTKQQKDEALRTAQEMETKLEQEEEVCNETMKTLWEECKPCLKNTCVKYYSRTCSSGSGLVGRQLEDVLNRTSPFSIWINGEKIDVLEQEDRRQNKEFKNLEEKYTVMADGVDSIFSDSMKVADHVHYSPPSFFLPSFLSPFTRHSRSVRSLFHDPFQGFQSLFSPMVGMGKNFFGSMDSMMDMDTDTASNEDGSMKEDVMITQPFGTGRMTCREIRRNSAGCIKFRDECQKCKDIQHLDCSGRKPLEGPLKEDLEEALAMAERFTQQYNSLLRRFEEQMFNTSSILDLFNRQFGWVSSLANNTDSQDGIFHVQTVVGRDSEEKADEEKKPRETDVSLQLFDSPTMNISVRGDIPWTDPKFSEVVAQEALDRYKGTAVLVK
ncbi:clusterin [Hippoglossus hippoglossus]|uniref:clusterin n=1 Tax=Hippoglossus hippoglossus TaxID=8267 RepID=UPI00148D3C89|nr:clusterin [Hippoglossus hippoglossus]XP_034436393.1 clusterin [Hippoglossus hippoglossus]XP_034436394.1 clusterin [Hippoglossus hippoglossus]XP_034999551.2 clusterin [Hippoglossus stenolepis]